MGALLQPPQRPGDIGLRPAELAQLVLIQDDAGDAGGFGPVEGDVFPARFGGQKGGQIAGVVAPGFWIRARDAVLRRLADRGRAFEELREHLGPDPRFGVILHRRFQRAAGGQVGGGQVGGGQVGATMMICPVFGPGGGRSNASTKRGEAPPTGVVR